jgi:hypothetical protein
VFSSYGNETFVSFSHLIPTNELATLHNRCMLKALNAPIACCVVEQGKSYINY